MADKYVVHCSHGKDDAERASLGLLFAKVSAASAHETVLFTTAEGVRLATPGYVDDMHHEGFKPLKEILKGFIDNGGQIWCCAACTNARGISDADLIEGARIAGADDLIAYMEGGAKTLA